MSNEEQAQKDEAQPINEEATETHAEEVEEVVEELSAEQTRILELEAALAASEATLAAQKDSVMRAIADADNVRKRAEGEVDKARKFALEKFASELLPVADNLERALQVADKENEAIKPVIEGVEITLKSFVSSIEKFGMKVIDPQGESFNPEQHQAMSMQENAELPANTVMAVMQKGYELNGRLLRPAMVMVSRAPEGGVDTQA
ncbi:nucleotide exchange factor GrpE [Paraglaciecola chathamensis]|jgi:molecular chaperone GrpE|uniref:Protein GrpE n=3 Tax=Paraglaciecola chathamensis TaxID=368405 RepID=A0A8H9I977_9ALTE|nr:MULTISPECIES: nucleotide exchange factor GrpE [Paraglaciecola]AEE23213.1 GrpE protein [Glaciecola sp. 4H-3-7+YE-5]MBN23771.1 nucleotide exchange factor GrpE [Alteromonadaceae bacterium]MBJ2136138.1 nucleotide exchange factor GrpE [Paraglaciecola chathamensis]MBU3016928.1 nucleotide exchange factor GrpE [Paraglaciecola agarilytica]MDO6557740.1 nucleotide exchange factor GrpE [Paraglaciecola chathamensis]|tara:strand:+ start:3673 stop:4287 length:615 start_codon:yes stop_codon:yes gene_type:complete